MHVLNRAYIYIMLSNTLFYSVLVMCYMYYIIICTIVIKITL